MPEVREQFAALAVSGVSEALDGWPADDALVRDCPSALGALEAYCEGDDERLHNCLGAIPFRSPFRDLRQILKALIRSGSDPESASGMLARISESSPFTTLADAAQVLLLPDERLLSELQQLDRETRTLVATLKGWSGAMLPFCHELAQLGGAPSPDALLRFLQRHRKLLGDDFIRRTGLRILIRYPKGRSIFTRTCGKPGPFEWARIGALYMETLREHPLEIIETWEEAVMALDSPDQSENPEQALTAALILRRMASEMLHLPDSESRTIPYLVRSLELDPEERSCHIRLISLYRKDNQLKQARAALDRAMGYFPEDVGVLEEAVETALAGNAYKKAATLAARILNKDPINQRVRDALIGAHLAHARKQIDQDKLALAEKELDTAAGWARSEPDHSRVELVQGILLLAQDQNAAAESRLKSGEARSGGGLAGRFCLLMELVRMKRHVPTVMKQANLPKPAGKPSTEDILRLTRLLNNCSQGERKQVAAALEHLMVPLRRSAGGGFHISEMKSICETWGRFDLHDLRLRFARAALKQWRRDPVFVFHRVAAEAGQSGYLSEPALDQLSKALDRAGDAGDTTTIQRIRELAEKYDPHPLPDYYDEPFFPDADMPYDEPDLDTMVEMVMGDNAPPEIREMKAEFGEQGMRKMVEQFLERLQNDDEIPFEDNRFDFFDPSPKKRKRKAKKKSRTKPINPDQMDLF